MSAKRKKPRTSHFRRPAVGANQSPNQAPDAIGRSAENANWAEMSGNGGEIQLFAPTFRQQAALPVIASSPTIAQAARASGVGESTIRRWLDDPAFRDHLLRLRQEPALQARREVQCLTPICASVFAEAMQSPDPALRLRAARYASSFILRISEVEQLNAGIWDLEEALRLR